jgi:hypothetical protein
VWNKQTRDWLLGLTARKVAVPPSPVGLTRPELKLVEPKFLNEQLLGDA